MKVQRVISVPTGDILLVHGNHGLLETVSLGDYGKAVNLQGLPVPDGLPLLPLTEKWVITVSTQYGCSMGCSFCDVPKVGPGRNATLSDLQGQVIAALHLHPEITRTDRLNVHYARMGEPTWNPAVLDHARWLKDHIDPEYHAHPVVSTMMPAGNQWLKTFIHAWMRIKNRVFRGDAGLQLSLNSTDEDERAQMFSGNAMSLWQIAKTMDGIVPVGRKITLNFPVASWRIDPAVLLRFFEPERYIVKLTPMHATTSATKGALATPGDPTTPAPYETIRRDLVSAGYEVLVFIASREEDESMITCGNAVLSGRDPKRMTRDRWPLAE